MDKFSLIIGDAEQPFSGTFDLVIRPADVERLQYLRDAVGDCRLPAALLNARAIDEHIAAGEVNLHPVEIGALAGDLKRAGGAIDLHPIVIGARATGEKPDRQAVGHVFLHWIEARARVVGRLFEAGAAVVLFPPAIGARAIEGAAESLDREAEGRVRLQAPAIGARTNYASPASGCFLAPCSMIGRDLVRRFRELSQDEVEPYLWDDCFVLNMLNEAEREAADRAKLLYDDSLAVAVDVTAGRARYAIDPHIIDIERAALTADGDGGPPLRLKLFDRLELDWRTPTRSQHEAGLPWGRPFGLVFDGKHEVEIVPGPRRNGRLLLGVHRLPWAAFDMGDAPEIPCVHHLALVDWALFRAFSIPDADEANEQLATFYLNRFEQYFGRRIDARKRRLQRANKPHVNKLW